MSIFIYTQSNVYKIQASNGNESASCPNKCHYIECNIVMGHHLSCLGIL